MSFLLKPFDIHAYVRAQWKVFCALCGHNKLQTTFTFPSYSKHPLKRMFVWWCYLQSLEEFVIAYLLSGEKQTEITEMQSTENDWNGPWVDFKPPQLLIASIPLIHSEWATLLLRVSACSPKPHRNTTFIFRHSGALPTCHEIAFHYKTSSNIKGRTKSPAISEWSKIDQKYTLMACNTYRSHYYCNITKNISLLDRHMQHRFAWCISEIFVQ